MNNTTNGTDDDNGFCSPFDTLKYVAVALTAAATGLVSTVACAGVIGIIVVFRKYYFHTQRIILYLNIAAFLNSFSIVLRVQRIWYESDSEALKGFCIATAAFDNTTAWCELIAIACITVDLFVKALFRKETYKLEKLYFFMIFIFPLTFNWIPFIHFAYGDAGAWCWIRSEDPDTCKRFTFGNYLRFAIWYIPLYIILIVLIAIYVAIICRLRQIRSDYSGPYNPESEQLQQQMKKEIKPLLWYPVIYFILNIFPLINRIHDTFDSDPNLVLWILHAVFSPLQGGFIALAYTLDMETLKRLKCAELRAALTSREGKVREYSVRETHTDSFTVDDSTTTLAKETKTVSHQYNGTGVTTDHR